MSVNVALDGDEVKLKYRILYFVVFCIMMKISNYFKFLVSGGGHFKFFLYFFHLPHFTDYSAPRDIPSY